MYTATLTVEALTVVLPILIRHHLWKHRLIDMLIKISICASAMNLIYLFLKTLTLQSIIIIKKIIVNHYVCSRALLPLFSL